MIPDMRLGREYGALLLADISGYTAFLEDVRVAHTLDAFADGRIPEAYVLMSSLLDGIATRVDPPFTLVKFEGDAVFAVAADEVVPRGPELEACIHACYRDFAERLATASLNMTCTCNICRRKGFLDLKFVVHHGEYIVQRVGRHTEVLGPEVTLAHRLLKSRAASLVGSPAYALFTEAAVTALGLRLHGALPLVEHFAGSPDVAGRVVALGTNSPPATPTPLEPAGR